MAILGGAFFVLVFLAAMLTGGVAHAEPSVAEPHADDFLNSGIDAAEDGGLGHAVLAFERAHLAAPLDREIQDARAAAQAEARRRRAEGHTSQSFVEGEPSEVTWWRFFSSFRTDTYAAVLLAATWLLFGLLLARRRTERTAVRDALVVGSLLAVIFVAGAAMMWVGAMATQELGVAVVVEDEVRFRDAPDELARLRSQPNLYQGAVVVILEQRSEFSRIRLVDGENVWVRNGAAIYVE
jgi:hypothetical protein